MTILDLAVLALIGAGAALAVRSIRRDRKKGGCAGCTGCAGGTCFRDCRSHAWDLDNIKVTPQEAREIKETEASGFVDESDIDRNDLSRWAE